jgi:hypothetical protein
MRGAIVLVGPEVRIGDDWKRLAAIVAQGIETGEIRKETGKYPLT